MTVPEDPSAGWQVWQDQQIAHRFTDVRRIGVLGAEAQFDTMLRLLEVTQTTPMTVLDIGCGDGVVLATVMSRFCVEQGVLLDGSPAMLAKARERFARTEIPVTFIEADFNAPSWSGRLPIRAFDAVVSAFAIHHSEDDRKRALYAEIYRLLKPGGVFVNIEHVASASPLGEWLFEKAYAGSLTQARRARGETVTEEEVYEELRLRPDKAANRLTSVETQLQWLRAIGFRDVDCYWKQFELAVLAGYREREGAPARLP